MKVLITGGGNAISLGRMLQYYDVNVKLINPVPIIPDLMDVDISIIMGAWSWGWILRTQILSGHKIYRIQGTDAYNMSLATKTMLYFMTKKGDSIVYAGENLKEVVKLSGDVIVTPVDTKLFYFIEDKDERSIDVLYYCPKGREHIYCYDKLEEYMKNHPKEKVTVLKGKVPHEEMPNVYRRHKKYIRWTTHDANPKMPYEALICGCEVWHNGKQIKSVPEYMLMENAIPKWIEYFRRIMQ